MTYIQPLLLAFFLIAAAGLVRIRKCRGVGLVAAGLASLFLLSWPPVDWLLSLPLEARYTRRPARMESAQSIVVLGSSASPPEYGTPYFVSDKDMYERCALAAWLHTHGHPLPILACGGGATGKQPVSGTMQQLLQASGVPESMIWTERHSRSTHENATYGAAILREHGIGTILLVTEASDMLRAEQCFRKEGLSVIPYAFAFRDIGPALDELMPSWKAIDRNERTLHETLGLGWYWLRGWI